MRPLPSSGRSCAASRRNEAARADRAIMRTVIGLDQALQLIPLMPPEGSRDPPVAPEHAATPPRRAGPALPPRHGTAPRSAESPRGQSPPRRSAAGRGRAEPVVAGRLAGLGAVDHPLEQQQMLTIDPGDAVAPGPRHDQRAEPRARQVEEHDPTRVLRARGGQQRRSARLLAHEHSPDGRRAAMRRRPRADALPPIFADAHDQRPRHSSPARWRPLVPRLVNAC